MPTIREYLGDEKIAKLESMGFLPSVVTELAKTQYYKERQAKRNELSGDLVQKVMRGEIDKKTALGAQKFQDIGQKTHGLALGGAHTLTGIANAAERVSDFINPFYEGERDEKGEYVYKNAIEKTFRDKVKKAEEYRDDWEKATGKTAWGSHLTEGAYEIVADPVNLIGGYGLLTKGGKLAQFAKKSLYFSATGAASMGVSSLGEGADDKETATNMAIGAGAGFALGHAVDQALIRIQKLLGKRGVKVKESTISDENFIKKAEDSEFLDSSAPGGSSGGGGQGGVGKTTQNIPDPNDFSVKTINDEMIDAPIEAKRQVLKEVVSGNETSKIISQEKYQNILNDIKEYGEQYEVIKFQDENSEAANLFDQDLKNSLNNIQKAKENSINRYNEAQKATIKYKQENPNLTPKMLKGLINTNYKPTPEEIYITRAINNGVDVENRVSGYNILYALERDIASQNPYLTPEMYFSKIKSTGYNDEVAEVFSEAYAKRNADIAEDFVASKIAEYEYDGAVKNLLKRIKEKGIRNENSRAESAGEVGRVRNSLFDLGDNASRAEAGQAGDAQIPQNGGSDIAVGSENFGRAKIDEAVEERGAAKFDDADNAGISSEQVVSKQGEGAKEIDFINKTIDENVLNSAVKNKQKLFVGLVDEDTSKALGFKYPNVKRTIYADEIIHTLKQHGNEAIESKRGQISVTLKDISNYREYVKNADRRAISRNKRGELVLISGKQINGHYVVVEEVQRKNNNLAFKTMYLRKGMLDDNKIFESAPVATSSQRPAFSSYEDDARRVAQTNKDIISQNGGYHTSIGNKQEENTGVIQTFIPQGSKSAGELGLPTNLNKISDEAEVIFKSGVFEKDSAFASRTDFGKTPIKANVKTATSSDTVRSSGGLKPIEHSSDKGIISKKIKNGEDIDFSDKKVVDDIQKSVDSFVKDSLKDINVKDEILREFDLKNVKTLAKGKATELNEAQIKTLKKDISNSQIKSINENKFYFDKVGKDGDKKRFFLDIDENGAVKIDGFSKADIDEIPVRKSAMDELIGKDKLKGMSFEEKAAYHNELDPIKKEKIVKTAELNRLKREVRGIANVAFNDKKSTLVNKDLSVAEEFIKFEKGIENPVSKKGFGAEHIKKHLDPKESGFVTKKEYLKMGDVIRNGEMSLKDGKRIYEAYNDEGVRFRVIAGEKNGKERIISFFSNRKPGIENNTLTYNYSGHNEIINFKSKKQLIAERKLEEFKAKNLDEDGNIKDGLELC